MPPNTEIPKHLAALLAAAPKVTPEEIQEAKRVGEEAERDPIHLAGLQKAFFVNSILNALNDEGLTKSEVARRMGCSRQNLNRLLSEHESVNFTIETMSGVAAAANRRAVILVLSADEVAFVRPSVLCALLAFRPDAISQSFEGSVEAKIIRPKGFETASTPIALSTNITEFQAAS